MTQAVNVDNYPMDFRGLLLKNMNFNLAGWKTLVYLNNFYNITTPENATCVKHCLTEIDNHPFHNFLNNFPDKNKKESQIPFIIELRNLVKKYRNLNIGGMKTLIDIVTFYDSMTNDYAFLFVQCLEGLDSHSMKIHDNSIEMKVAITGGKVCIIQK